MLISISGVDCAGKSTHIELLRQHFVSNGQSCAVFWYRPGYSAELERVKKLVRLILAKSKHQTTQNETAMSGSDTLPPPVWLVSALADTLIQWGAKLRLLMQKYDVVICDRFIYDAMLDLFFKYPHELWSEHILWLVSHFFPKPDHALLLWLPLDEMNSRAAAKNEPFPDPDEIRELRWKAYDLLKSAASWNHLEIVDASGSIDETHQAIMSALRG